MDDEIFPHGRHGYQHRESLRTRHARDQAVSYGDGKGVAVMGLGYAKPEHVAGERARKMVTDLLASNKRPQTWSDWIDWAQAQAHHSRIFDVYLMNQRDCLAQVCALFLERLETERTLGSVGTQEVSWNHHHAQMSVSVKPSTWKDRVRWWVLGLCWWVIEKLEGQNGEASGG